MLLSVDLPNAAFPFMYVILFLLMRASGQTHFPYCDHRNHFWRGLEFRVFTYIRLRLLNHLIVLLSTKVFLGFLGS
jgi:hypothetical protein